MSTDRRSGGAVRPAGAARRAAFCGFLAVSGLALAGCRQDMHDQPRYEPLEASAFFADGKASREPVAGTIARGQLQEDEAFFTGRSAGSFVGAPPMTVDRSLLERGRERFDIFCSPCHGRLGDGNGMVVRRGFKQARSFHVEPLKSQPVGYYFDVMTHGFGQMPSYASQVPAHDRWAIAAYVRVLQLARGATVSELEAADREALEAAIRAAGEPAAAADGAAHPAAEGH